MTTQYITAFHPFSLIPIHRMNLQAHMFAHEIPVAATDNYLTTYFQLSIVTTEDYDVVNNYLKFTIYWTYIIPETVTFKLVHNISGHFYNSSPIPILLPWEMQTSVINVRNESAVTANHGQAFRLSSYQVPAYILGVLVEVANDN